MIRADLLIALAEVEVSAKVKPPPDYLYHAADPRIVKSIQKKGLLAKPDYILDDPEDKDGVNLGDYKHRIPDHFQKNYHHLFRVKTSNLDHSKLQDFGDGWHRYAGTIPPHHVEYLGRGDGKYPEPGKEGPTSKKGAK